MKDEMDLIKADQETLQTKVKEYKAKCKTLKKNNLAHQDQIKDLEKKSKENEPFFLGEAKSPIST